MRLLALAPAPELAAATRFRVTQYFAALQQNGIEATLRPFLDERGFQLLYRAGGAPNKAIAAARAIAGRIADLCRATSSDAVFIQREAALVGPPDVYKRQIERRIESRRDELVVRLTVREAARHLARDTHGLIKRGRCRRAF